MKKNRLFFTQKFLENRPAFFCLIRPIEADLIFQNKKIMKNKILDFGCGDGFFASLIFDKNEIDVGLDVSESRIDEANNKEVYKKLLKYDGKVIPFPNNHFSSVLSNSVLEHVPSLDQNIKEIYRVLKPGSYFITTVMTQNWNSNILGNKIFGKSYQNWLEKQQVHLNLLAVEKWRSKFVKAGFKIEDEVGYLNPRSSKIMELWHYLSLPSFFCYKIFGKWVNNKNWYKLFNLDKYFETINKDSFTQEKPASVFFILKK